MRWQELEVPGHVVHLRLHPSDELVATVIESDAGTLVRVSGYGGTPVGDAEVPGAERVAWSDNGTLILASTASGDIHLLETAPRLQSVARLACGPGISDVAWLDHQTALVVGSDKLRRAWASVVGVPSGLESRFELEPPYDDWVRTWARWHSSNEPPPEPPSQAEPGARGVTCGAHGRVAVHYSSGFREAVDLYRVTRETAVIDGEPIKVDTLESPRLSKDGECLLPGRRFASTVTRLAPRQTVEVGRARAAQAHGRGLVVLSEDGRRLQSWRLDTPGIDPWDDDLWLAGGETAVLDIVERSTTSDLAVVVDGRVRFHRLADPDVIDVRHHDAVRRLRGAAALERRGDPAVATALAPMLGADIEEERQAALAALLATGGEALDVIVGAVGTLNEPLAAPLRVALAALAQEPLESCVRRCLRHQARTRRRGAAMLLTERADVSATDDLCVALDDAAPDVRAHAVRALERRADLRAIPALLAALSEDDPAFVGAVERALRATLARHRLVPETAEGRLTAPGTSTVRYVDGVLAIGDWTAPPPASGALLDAVAAAMLSAGSGIEDVLNAIDGFAGSPRSRGMGLVLGLRVATAAESANRTDDAARLYEQAERRAKMLDEAAALWHIQLRRGVLAEGIGLVRTALAHYTDAMSTVDHLWARLLGDPQDARFFADKAQLYDRALRCQVRLGHAALAIETLEKAKTRYLGDLIARRHNPPQRRVEVDDELFWESVGQRRPVAIARDAGEGPREIVRVQVGGTQPEEPVPRGLWALLHRTSETPADLESAVTMVRGAWLLAAGLDEGTVYQEEVVRTALENVHAALVELRTGEGMPRERFREAADAIAESGRGHGYWELKEMIDRPFNLWEADPDGSGGVVLDALLEATGYPGGEAAMAAEGPPPEPVVARPSPFGFSPHVEQVWPAFTAARTGVQRGAGRLAGTSALQARMQSRWVGRERIARGETVTFREAVGALDAKTALLVFALTDEETVTFVATGAASLEAESLHGWQGPAVFTNPRVTTHSVQRCVVAPWLAAYAARGTHRKDWEEATRSALRWLYAELFKPVSAWLADRRITRLLVVPHRGLHLLPLAAWHDDHSSVVDRFDVCLAPSLTLNDICRRRSVATERTTKTIVAIHRTRGLVFSGVEAASLGYRGRALEILQAPTVKTFATAAADASTVHFAGHARYDWEDALASGLELADGLLSLGALFDDALPLRTAPTVALAACETTMTDPDDPVDEYLGVGSGFVFSGAPAVLSTLWSVDDVSSALLLHRFYTEVGKGARPSAALAIAQRHVRDEVRGSTVISFIDELLESGTPVLDGRVRDLLRARRQQIAARSRRERRRHLFGDPTVWAPFTVSGVDTVLH